MSSVQQVAESILGVIERPSIEPGDFVRRPGFPEQWEVVSVNGSTLEILGWWGMVEVDVSEVEPCR